MLFIGGWHAFEAKCRSHSLSNRDVQLAINQVSRLLEVNGAPPNTRVACCFNTSGDIHGRIVDPPPLTTGLSFEFRVEDFLKEYYKPFLIPGHTWTDSTSDSRGAGVLNHVGV